MRNSLPILGIALTLGIASTLFFSLPATTQSAAPAVQDLPLKERTFARLIAESTTKGPVRIIVGLDQHVRPVGELGRDELANQKVSIKTGQDEFLNRYPEAHNEKLIHFQFIPFVAMTVSAATLEAMRDDPSIKSIEEDVADPPNLAESTVIVGTAPAWNAGFDGSGQAVAILDTGVNKNHTFLQGKVVSEACYSKTISGSSTSVCPGGAQSSTDPDSGLNCDPAINGCAHGTHVAGTAAGTSASFSGVGMGANIIAVQVFSRFDSTASCSSGAPCMLSYASDQVLGLERVLALASTIDIAAVNMSLGGGQYFAPCDDVQTARKAAIDNLRSVEIPTVISSGNTGYTNAMGAPACISSAISVGSTGDGSSGATADVVVSSSNSASFLSILAPGRWITSSVAAPGSNNTFQAYSGTSMAAPHVAGAFALLRERNPSISVTDGLNILLNTGTPILDSRNNITKPRLQVDRAVSLAGATCQSQPIFVGQTTSGQFLTGTDCNFANDFGRFYDRYTFSAVAGQDISVALNAGFDAHLRLVNEADQVVAEDDNGGGGTNARIPAGSGSFSIPATGNYSIIATSSPTMTTTLNSVGAYSLSLNGTCSYSFSSGSASFDTSGGMGNFNINVSGSCPWAVTSSANWLAVTSSPTGSGNTTVNFTVAANTGGGRSATITGIGQTFTVSQSGINSTAFDYDGDGRADLAVVRPANNTWYLLRGTAGFTAMQFGEAGDRMVPADYDGDGKTDVAVWRPSNGRWYIYMSQTQTFEQFGWGQDGDLPVPTDRNNDGTADLVIYRPSNNTWYTRFSNGTFHTFQFGVAGDKPMLGDFDGDGIGDVALFRPSNNNWYIIKSSLGFFIQTWGEAGDIPLTGDFDGDGATDQAVFRPSTGQWYLSQTTAGFSVRNWGQAGDIPVPADYDGDGKTDIAVFRPSTGIWYLVQSTDGILYLPFGQDGDLPTKAAFVY